jgi:hypothetical protein
LAFCGGSGETGETRTMTRVQGRFRTAVLQFSGFLAINLLHDSLNARTEVTKG